MAQRPDASAVGGIRLRQARERVLLLVHVALLRRSRLPAARRPHRLPASGLDRWRELAGAARRTEQRPVVVDRGAPLPPAVRLRLLPLLPPPHYGGARARERQHVYGGARLAPHVALRGRPALGTPRDPVPVIPPRRGRFHYPPLRGPNQPVHAEHPHSQRPHHRCGHGGSRLDAYRQRTAQHIRAARHDARWQCDLCHSPLHADEPAARRRRDRGAVPRRDEP
mmetsp:Transcript_64915/g.135354  ORF Transcript_64915/g.135354 Transcript_64915/m.135354 type:complete len:224 (-) Transcript_64915:4696-5367(-)